MAFIAASLQAVYVTAERHSSSSVMSGIEYKALLMLMPLSCSGPLGTASPLLKSSRGHILPHGLIDIRLAQYDR